MLKKAGFVAAIAVLGAYVFVAFRGPQGLPALATKHAEIEKLQESNADLQREIETKRERIQRLKTSEQEQELVLRQKLQLTKPGETVFITPDAKK